MNTTTAAAPASAHAQNRPGTRSRVRSTEAAAVAAGSRPMTTAAWLAGTSVSAADVQSGKPTTTPPATTARRSTSVPRGRRGRTTASRTAASDAGDDGPAGPDERGVELLHRDPRQRHRERERQDAESTPRQTGAGGVRGKRPPHRCDSAIVCRHGRR